MDKLVIGLILGSSLTFFAFLGSYFFLNWVKEKTSQIASIKWELQRYSMELELWHEFQFWKREQKENK